MIQFLYQKYVNVNIVEADHANTYMYMLSIGKSTFTNFPHPVKGNTSTSRQNLSMYLHTVLSNQQLYLLTFDLSHVQYIFLCLISL